MLQLFNRANSPAKRQNSVLAVIERDPLPLREDVGLESLKPRIVVREGLAAHRIFDAPVDHVAEQRDAPQLHLKLGIGFGMGVGGVRMAHVAGYGISAAKRLGVVKNALAFRDQAIGRLLPNPAVTLGKGAVGLELFLGRSLDARQLGLFWWFGRGDPFGIGMLLPPFRHQRIGNLLPLL